MTAKTESLIAGLNLLSLYGSQREAEFINEVVLALRAADKREQELVEALEPFLAAFDAYHKALPKS